MPDRFSPARLVLATLLFAAALLVPLRDVQAALYDVPILVDSEDDLRDLLEEGEISQEEFERLLYMLERPLDLNRSRREALYDLPGLTWPMVDHIIEYREQQPFRAVADLEDADIPVDVIRQIRSFAKVAQRLQRPPVVEGDVRLRGIEQIDDGQTPSFYVRARARLWDKLDVGVTGLLQDRVGPFSWHHEPGFTWLSADGTAPRFQVPKFYVMMEEPGWAVIVGSYQIGFGERLVFDESTRLEPNGFYPDDLLPEYEDTAKFGVPERMYGVAASLRELPLGEGMGAIDATLWFSYWPYDVSQNDVDSFLRTVDDDDRLSSSGGPNPLFCEAGVDPELCASSDPDLQQGRFNFRKLRAAFTELVVGGNVAYLPTPQWRIGVTGYWAMIDWLESGDDLFFSPAAAWPNRDQYGAFGVDVQGHVSFLSLFAEYARTFDGGNAASGRVVLGWKRFDVELGGRWYQASFDNPHARGSAAPDEYRGQRDRDEVGGNVRVTFRPLRWLNGRIDLDLWHRQSLDYSGLALTTRFDFLPLDWLVVSTGVDYTDKVLSQGGRDEDYDDSAAPTRTIVDPYTRTILSIEDDRTPGRGARVAAWLQLRFDLFDRLRIVGFYKSTLWDTEVSERATYYPKPLRLDLHEFYQGNFAHDFYTWLMVSYKPIDVLEVSARVKYLDEETEYDIRGDSYVESWFQVRWRIIDPVVFQLRYRVRAYTDEDLYRGSSDDSAASDGSDDGVRHVRVGEVEHLIKGVVEVKF